MWVEFVVCSRLAPRVFSLGCPVFLSPQNSTLIIGQDREPAKADGVVFFLDIDF